MPLPISPLPTTSVSVNGAEVVITSLTRTQARRMRELAGSGEDADAYVVSCATGEPLEAATAWFDQVDNDSAVTLLRAILVLSGLVEEDEGSPKA